MARGRLIVLEGPEGVGKSTQHRLLADHLSARGHDIVALREPGGTAVGDAIRALLLDPSSEIAPAAEALLYMASRAQLVETAITPALARGATVLLDRFFLATYAYQGAGRGIPADVLSVVNRMATGGLVVPDLTLVLTLPVTEGLARAARRGGHDRMERADLAFHERVAGAFATFADPTWQAGHPECGPIVVVDAIGTEREVLGRLLGMLRARWPESFA
jgi:dTMP kinase